MSFNRPCMCVYKNGSAWEVGEVDIVRSGLETFSVAARNPEAVDGGGLPLGRPFRCEDCVTDASGVTTGKLRFAAASIATWHGTTSPFDACRSVRLLMKIEGAPDETLIVDLCCREHSRSLPHPPVTFLKAVVQAAVAVAMAVVRFFRRLFVPARHERLAPEAEEAELAAEGPNGSGERV